MDRSDLFEKVPIHKAAINMVVPTILSMIGNIAGSITNIILDPIMILWMNMGVQGAAVATVIGNGVACLIYVSYFFHKPTQLSISFKGFHPTPKLAWEPAYSL